jgi:hypothetical protein
MNPKQTIQAFLDAINSQDWIRLDSLVATDFVRHSIAAGESPVRSRGDLVRFLRREYETFRRIRRLGLIRYNRRDRSHGGSFQKVTLMAS